MFKRFKQNGLRFISICTYSLFMTKKDKKSEVKEVDPQDSEIAELRSTLQRVQAEFENYQKRQEKEMSDYKVVAGANIMSDLLPVLDTLEQGMLHNQEFATVKEQLESILKKKGLEKIHVEPGDTFDHDKMECLLEETV